MSDSLREQMLQAGFKQSTSDKKRTGNNKSRAGNNSAHKQAHQQKGKSKNHSTAPSSMERANIAEREAIAERKRIKAEIKTIIEADKVGDTKGEVAHSYVVGTRIKQMFVTAAVREKLVDSTLVITRLNGSTYIVPAETGDRVQALNPDWVVIKTGDEPVAQTDDEYADYKVPDDITW